MGMFSDDGTLNVKSSETSQVSSSSPFQWEQGEREWQWKPLERMEASLQESFGSLWAAGAAVTDVLGLDGASDWAMKRSGELFQKAADKQLVNTDFSEIDSPIEAGKYAVELITSFIPDIAMMIVGGAGLGTAAGRAAARGYGAKTAETMLHKGFTKNLKEVAKDKGLGKDEIYKEAIRRTVKDAGALVGVAGIEGGQGAGQAFALDREMRGEDASGMAAIATGAAQSAISMFNPLNRVLAGKLPKGKASVLKMTGGEAAEEMGQEIPAMMHEAGIDPNKTFEEIISSEEGLMRLLESGVAGAILGSAFGGGMRAMAPKPQDTVTEIIETPERSLDFFGIDTSQDTKMPNIEEVVSGLDRGILSRDVPEAPAIDAPQWQDESYQAKVQQEADTKAYEPELPPTTLENIEAQKIADEEARLREAPPEPQWKTDPEMVRKQKAAEEIRQAGPWSEDGRSPVEQVIEETKDIPKPTKLTDKKAIKDAAKIIEEVKETGELPKGVKAYPEPEPEPVKWEDQEIVDVPQDTNIDNTDEGVAVQRAADLTAKEQAAQQEILDTEETKKSLKGWIHKQYEVDGKKISTYEKGNSKIIKYDNRKWQLVNDDAGAMDDRGYFKSFKDAREAQERGVTSEDFYQNSLTKKEARKQQPLTEEQGALLQDFNISEVTRIVQEKTDTVSDSEAPEVIAEAVIDAAKTYTPDKKATFRSYAMGNAIGAVKDMRKTRGTTEIQDVTIEDDAGAIVGKVEGTSKQDMETIYVKPREAKTKTKEKAPPVKKVEVSQEEKDAILKRFQEAQAKKGAPVPKKQKAPVESISKMREESQALSEADEDMADNMATDFSINSESSLKALEEFDKKYAGKKLTEVQQEARQILVDAVAIDAEAGERFKKKYPDGLALLEKTIDSIDPEVSSLARFLLTNPAIRKKLREVNVQKALKGSSRYSPDTNTIFMKSESGRTAIHELVHSVTVNEMASSKEFRDEVTGMMDVVKWRLKSAGVFTDSEIKLLESYKTSDAFKKGTKDWGDRQSIAYSLINTNEFLSQAFSSQSFQSFLKEIKVESPKRKRSWTLWNNLIELVGKVLGISKKNYSMLEKIITYVPEIAEGKISKRGLDDSYAPPPSSKTDRAEQIRIMKENDSRGKPKDLAREWLGKAGEQIRDIGKGVTERLRKIDHTLIRPIREMEYSINRDNKKYQVEIKDFIDGYNRLSKDDKLMLDLTLMNREESDLKVRNEILRRNNLTTAYKKVEKVLADIHKEKGKVGLNNYKDMPDYFPRRVKDVRALMQTIKDDPNYNVIQAELDRMGEDATDTDKEKAIQQMIHTGRFPSLALLSPTASKRRTINRVSSKWKHHYDNSQDALINHIYESTEAIHARKLLGDVHRKELVQKRDSLYKELEGDKIKGKKAREKKVGQIQLIEDQLNDFDTEMNEGLTKMLREKAPNLTTKQADTVIRLIRARLTQKGMHGVLATLRNVSLMSVLSSPTSAITQIGDLAFSIYRYGPVATVEAILGKKMITPEDLDLAGSMKEFQSEGSAKWLDKTLKWSGLQFMDSFGKTTTMNAAIRSAKKMSLEKFTQKYGEYYGKDTKQLYNDLKSNKKTELTQFFAFNELSEVQPISMSEMPLTYLTAGNGRIFYALKSYNIKAMNTIYRESVHKWRTAKSSKEKADAMKGVGKLILLMTFAGATADELKDFLLGKDAGTFSDSVQDNLLKIAFMSRYTLDQGFSKGIFETLSKDILLPPMGFVDDPLTDMAKIVEGDPDFKTLTNLPWGKIPYSWLSDTEESKDMRNLREEVMDEYKKGGSLGSIRKRMNEYNAWVRQQEDDTKRPITLSSLTRAKQKYRKEQRT